MLQLPTSWHLTVSVLSEGPVAAPSHPHTVQGSQTVPQTSDSLRHFVCNQIPSHGKRRRGRGDAPSPLCAADRKRARKAVVQRQPPSSLCNRGQSWNPVMNHLLSKDGARASFPKLCHGGGNGQLISSSRQRRVVVSESDNEGEFASENDDANTSSKARNPAKSRQRKNQGKPRSGSTRRASNNKVKKGGTPDASATAGEDKPHSLFGMGLLNRLEEQARVRRKRMMSSPPSLAHEASSTGAARCLDGSSFEDSGPSTLQLSQRNNLAHHRTQCDKQQGGAYAFSPDCIYNFVETRGSHCFPRQSAQEACQAILDAIHKCNVHEGLRSAAAEREKNEGSFPPVVADETLDVNLDHILSCVPYKDMLQDLFQQQAADQNHHRGHSSNIPVVTKSYEESFMREPMWDYERPCMMGGCCECNFISTRPGEGFTAVEFLLPSEDVEEESVSCDDEQGRRRSGSSSRPRQMCVLCHRKLVQSLFYDIIYCGTPYRGVIQRYGNICNHAGEYAREVMLICPPNGPVECMPFPSVSHQRNKYSVYSKGGIRYVKQNRLAWEDFCQAPPLSAVP